MRSNFLLLKNLTIITSIISILAFTQVPSGRNKINHTSFNDTLLPARNSVPASPNVVAGEQIFSFFDSTVNYNIYLPEGYASTRTRYPVVYLLNGPVFSPASVDEEDWMVDELLDSLATAGKQKSIVVSLSGIPIIAGQEDSLAGLLSGHLKTFIDKNYRTQPGQSVIAGTGAYADVALLTSLRYQQKFPRVGVFCPTDSLSNFLESHSLDGSGYSGMVFIYKNGSAQATQLADYLAANSSALLYTRDKQNIKGKETPFGGWFPEFFGWMMGNGFNYITK